MRWEVWNPTLVVAGPDHVVGDEPDVGEGVVGVDGVRDDLVAPVLQPEIVPDLQSWL